MKARHAGVVAALVLCLVGSVGHVRAGEKGRPAQQEPLTVDFIEGTEFVGVGLVPSANARPLVPAPYTLAGDGTNAQLAVRVSRSRLVWINRTPAGSATVSQVGILVEAPEGDGAVNVYTLFYDTDNHALAKALRKAGVDARYVPRLTYAFSRRGDALAIDVPPPSRARYAVGGSIIPPTFSVPEFVANWWFDTGDRKGTVIKMSTFFPSVWFGVADTTLLPDRNSPLRALIGDHAFTFPILDSFNTFQSGHMEVEER